MNQEPSPLDHSFESHCSRQATSSLKWEKYKGKDIIPLWVADMDFSSPPAVLSALHDRIDHGVFGYTLPPESLVDTVLHHLQHTYAWTVPAEALVWLPGLVCGLHVVCRAIGSNQDEVVTCTPIYPPFMSAPPLSDRRLLQVPLQHKEHSWHLDLTAIEQMITPRTKLLLLCNPHNPVGRVWKTTELSSLAALAQKHNLIICSDEIHAGLILDREKQHLPIALLDPETARRTITLHAPSKTFNIPGLGCSFAVINDKTLRHRVKRAMEGIVPHVNLLGYTATEAAYRLGEPWRQQLLAYLRTNRSLLYEYIAKMPGLSVSPVEATYLAWIDTRETGIQTPCQFFERAGVGLSDGTEFGAPGFLRLNFGCSRSLLKQALQRMQRALNNRE